MDVVDDDAEVEDRESAEVESLLVRICLPVVAAVGRIQRVSLTIRVDSFVAAYHHHRHHHLLVNPVSDSCLPRTALVVVVVAASFVRSCAAFYLAVAVQPCLFHSSVAVAPTYQKTFLPLTPCPL